MKIATWNINSIRARLESLQRWVKQNRPDILLLQEIKVTTELFPYEIVEEMGYNCAVYGQKTYNGTAILSRYPIEEKIVGLPGDEHKSEARWLEVIVKGQRFISVYVPNGQSLDSDRYQYKLHFLASAYERIKQLLQYEEVMIIGGDFNIAPTDLPGHDIYANYFLQSNCEAQEEILRSKAERAAYRRLLNLGLTDSIDLLHPQGQKFTWWDYRAGHFGKNYGWRIDHLLLSPEASDSLVSADVDLEPRGWDRPSDHAPVLCVCE